MPARWLGFARHRHPPGVARIACGHGCKAEAQITDRARQHTLDMCELSCQQYLIRGARLECRYAAERGPQARDAARISAVADGAGAVVAVGQWTDSASAAAAPPLEPPGVRLGSQGLSVRPCRALSVKKRALN